MCEHCRSAVIAWDKTQPGQCFRAPVKHQEPPGRSAQDEFSLELVHSKVSYGFLFIYNFSPAEPSHKMRKISNNPHKPISNLKCNKGRTADSSQLKQAQL